MLLELSHVTKAFGDLIAVNDLNLSVPQGQWLAIVGSSGSGKTTLMNIIGCLDVPTSGSVKLEGRALQDLNESQLADVRKNVIGLVFQKFHLIGHLTALENVMVAQYYHSVVDEDQAMDALRKVGLADRASHLPGQLSGGEQQRVCIARALINSPKLLLADEPTGNLDEANEKIVLELFRQLHEQGTTIIVVTHDALVASCAEREILLNHGVLTGETWNDPDAKAAYEKAGGKPAFSSAATDEGGVFVNPTKAAKTGGEDALAEKERFAAPAVNEPDKAGTSEKKSGKENESASAVKKPSGGVDKKGGVQNDTNADANATPTGGDVSKSTPESKAGNTGTEGGAHKDTKNTANIAPTGGDVSKSAPESKTGNVAEQSGVKGAHNDTKKGKADK